MGKKEDEAADFFLSMLERNVNMHDMDAEDEKLRKYQEDMDTSELKLDPDTEKEYQAYIKDSKKEGFEAVSRAEFLAIYGTGEYRHRH